MRKHLKCGYLFDGLSESFEADRTIVIDEDRTIHGYVMPVSGLRRFSVRKTPVRSCARPTNSTPSSRSKRAKYS